ncbi:MAG TPA: SHOCT domain-containing protein [Acidimicrobiales bacterium]
MPLGRRPVMRTVGRTAVIAGTATAVSGRVARRQNAKYASQEEAAAQQQMPVEQAPEGGGDDPMDQLKKLAELKDQGILTEEEFSDQKAKILAQM